MRWAAAWRLLRPGNGAMTSVGVLVGAVVAAGPDALATPWPYAAAVAGFLAAGFGNVLNDLTDVATDRLAHPERPLPRGDVPLPVARALAVVAAGVAAAIGFAISNAAGVFVLATLVVMVAYELLLKRLGLPGNVAVGALTGAPFVFGGLAVGLVPPSVVILAVLAALANLGREVIKDVEDMHADVDRLTLPRRVGRRSARLVAAVALVAGVALSPLPYVSGHLGWAYLPLVVVADAGFLAAAAVPEPRRGQRLAKAGMLVALGAFLAGRVTGGSAA